MYEITFSSSTTNSTFTFTSSLLCEKQNTKRWLLAMSITISEALRGKGEKREERREE